MNTKWLQALSFGWSNVVTKINYRWPLSLFSLPSLNPTPLPESLINVIKTSHLSRAASQCEPLIIYWLEITPNREGVVNFLPSQLFFRRSCHFACHTGSSIIIMPCWALLSGEREEEGEGREGEMKRLRGRQTDRQRGKNIMGRQAERKG